MRPYARVTPARTLGATAAIGILLTLLGCTAGAAVLDDPAPDGAANAAAERAAMECVTGAWVAETVAVQSFFDQAMLEAGVSDYEIIVEGSLVYEFMEHGFGLTVLPTGFGMRMPTGFGDVLGTITGQANGVWTVKGEYIHAVGDAWQNNLAMRWSFMGNDFEADTGTQELADGFTDVDHFECAGDRLVLQSADGPPLELTRMIEVP